MASRVEEREEPGIGVNKVSSRGRDKERVQFEFSEEALARLDRLRGDIDVSSRAEVVRKSLQLLEWVVEYANTRSDVIIRDQNDNILSQAPAKLLGITRPPKPTV